jgi:hypothetical protein
MKKFVAMVVVLISFGFASAQQHITSPEEAFGLGWAPAGSWRIGRSFPLITGSWCVSLRRFAMKSWTLQFQGHDSDGTSARL